jgi:hypothetical protein
MFLMLSDLLQNTSFPIEMLLGSAEGADHIDPVGACSTAPLSILTALQPDMRDHQINESVLLKHTKVH